MSNSIHPSADAERNHETDAPKRIQRKRAKGWRMPEGAVYVGRPSRWGNPFRVGELAQHWHPSGGYPYEMYLDTHPVVDAAHATRLYRSILTDPQRHRYDGRVMPTLDEVRARLGGRVLACWCPLDQPCHADVLLEIANRGEARN